jgi:hypothetical protein
MPEIVINRVYTLWFPDPYDDYGTVSQHFIGNDGDLAQAAESMVAAQYGYKEWRGSTNVVSIVPDTENSAYVQEDDRKRGIERFKVTFRWRDEDGSHTATKRMIRKPWKPRQAFA